MAINVAKLFIILFVIINVNGHKVIELDENNWTEILEGEWMVEFYAPWCPACKALEPRWHEFAKSGRALGIKVGAVDVTTSPGLSGRFMVTALPTVFHVLNGQFRQYKGARDTDSFNVFIEDRKWELIEPISSWKAPDSYQMSVIASFFKLSQTLRQIHSTFTVEYGLPIAVSYLIFAVATVILGACLGLVLVCAIDLLIPTKPTNLTVQTNREAKDKGDELNDDDIKDDLIDQQPDDDSAADDDDDDGQASSESELSQTDLLKDESKKQAAEKSPVKATRKRKARRADM